MKDKREVQISITLERLEVRELNLAFGVAQNEGLDFDVIYRVREICKKAEQFFKELDRCEVNKEVFSAFYMP